MSVSFEYMLGAIIYLSSSTYLSSLIHINFNNRYFITLEITLIHTVDIEDNKYYLNNIMEKVTPKSKTKFYKTVELGYIKHRI